MACCRVDRARGTASDRPSIVAVLDRMLYHKNHFFFNFFVPKYVPVIKAKTYLLSRHEPRKQRPLVASTRCKVVCNPNLDTMPFFLHQTFAILSFRAVILELLSVKLGRDKKNITQSFEFLRYFRKSKNVILFFALTKKCLGKILDSICHVKT